MCQFKSGIILKNSIKIAERANDSHSDLLESLGIKDDYLGASKTFVRAELVPDEYKWWVSPEEHPEAWKFIVDQDIVPDWFDKESHEKDFREAVCAWWKEHVLIDQTIDELSYGYYRLKRCKVKKLCKDVQAMLDDSTVQAMYDSSTVWAMHGSSTVQAMYDSSTVQAMLDDSTVQAMLDSSTVQAMLDDSTVREMYGNSTVQRMDKNATVQKMYGNSTVQRMDKNSTVREMYDNSTVQAMYDNSTVQAMYDNSTVREMYGSSTVWEMTDNSMVQRMKDGSMARDFKKYPQIRILIPDNPGKFEIAVHKGGNADGKEKA